MTLQRIYELLESERTKSDEFREEMIERLGAIETRIAVLETKEATSKDGWRIVGFVLSFLVSLAALGVSMSGPHAQ